MEELNKAWSEASQNMYGDGNAPGGEPQGQPGAAPGGEPAQDSADEDVEEADYTVVDDEDKK